MRQSPRKFSGILVPEEKILQVEPGLEAQGS